MARLEANLTVKTGKGADYLCEMTEQYSDILTAQQIVDNGDEYTQLASFGVASSIGGDAGLRMEGSKLIIVKNNSDIPVELQIQTTEWKDNSNVDELNSVDLGPDSATSVRQLSYILAANEYMVLPSTWMVSYAEAHSAGNAKTIDNKGGYDVNSGKLYSTAIVDIATALENDTTTFVVDDTDYFKVGDLIQLGSTTGTTATNIEIARVASITNSTTMILERGLYGSITADKDAQTDSTNGAVVNAKVYLPWFNTQEDYDKYHDDANALGIVQTNKTGRYTAQNLFGYGRTADGIAEGIVKGSLAFKFYNAGFQEFGLSGITPSTHSGLAASTAYAFNITVDGGSTFASLSFTTDASNLNFGGNNGIISKIQAALDTQYYTSGNLFEKAVSVGIVNGDIRFTSGTRTRNSAIALAAPSSGTTPFGVGRLPAIGSIEAAVAAKLPDDTIEDKTYNISKSNKSIFAYDDGKGNIIGLATGTINYETGAIDIQGPANAEFVVSFNYDSAHSGGLNNSNTIKTISARSLNSKIDAEVEILGFV
jgi:hypothetical protein